MWTPSPAKQSINNPSEDATVKKESGHHRGLVVEFEKEGDGHTITKVSISPQTHDTQFSPKQLFGCHEDKSFISTTKDKLFLGNFYNSR